jgi:hypothetical protein
VHLPWLEPWWLERQLDPDSPDFVPGGERRNTTHRTWAPLGALASIDRGVVDPRGAVTPWPGGWTLDWWIGADDRWHLPSREVAVRQHAVDGAPVIETAMRVPGGDAVHRTYAATAGGQAWLVVEVENRTAIPFAVAFAVRPANPRGDAPIGEVSVDESAIWIDGAPAVHLAKPPSRVAVGSAATGDALHLVTAGLAMAGLPAGTSCPDGRAHAVVIHPLPHTAVARVAVPLRPPARPGRKVRAVPAGAGSYPEGLASAEQVGKGWALQTGRGARFDLPDPALTEALAAARHQVLLAHAGDDLTSWSEGSLPWTGAAAVLGALDRLGFSDEAGQVLATLGERQRLDGSFGGADAGHGRDDQSADGAALHALGEHLRLTGDVALAEQLVGPVAKAGHRLAKRAAGRRRDRPGDRPEGPAWWAVRGLLDGAEALTLAGQPEAADELVARARAVRAEAEARLPRPTPATPVDVGALLAGVLGLARLAPAVGAVAAAGSGGTPSPADEHLAAAVERVRATTSRGAVFDVAGGTGFDLRTTLWLATVELAAGDAAALTRLAWVLEAASPAGTWPTILHPRTGGGSAGDGADPVVAAEVATFVRRLLVREVPGGLALCSLVPPAWLGQSWEVHGLPTARGRLGFAVRWHGERPALLWELEARPGAEPAHLTVPGLDPTWSSDEPRGEALLAPVAPPPAAAVGGDIDAGGAAEVARPGGVDVDLAPPEPPPGASSSFG